MTEEERIDQEMEHMLKSIGIPPRPTILMDLDAEARKTEPNFRKIEQLVASDVGLSATLLKTVNSPFYGLRNKASTISQAISVLGLSTLTRTVTGLMLKQAFAKPGRVDMERFWDASAKVALITSHVARKLPGMNRDEAYTFGLFQDCGIPVLMQKFPEYKETLGIANQAVDRKFTDVEDERHQTNHATIGYLLAKSWNLPKNLCSAIRFHHDFELMSEAHAMLPTESQHLIALALLSERIIQLHSGKAASAEWGKGGEAALHHLGLAHEEFEEIADDAGSLLDLKD